MRMLRTISLFQRINTVRNWPAVSKISLLHTSVQSNIKDADKGAPEGGVTDDVAMDPPIPVYVDKHGETIDTMRARLVYQSRKRGTLENGLLLSTFASRYLSSFTPEQLVRYDRLINKPSNDWDIYYWMVGTRDPPAEFDNDVMVLLKEHAKNKNNESRICQPDLKG